MSLSNLVTDNFKEYDFDTEYCLNIYITPLLCFFQYKTYRLINILYMKAETWYFLYWNFQHNQCLKIKNYAVYNIHRLAWGSFACGTTGQLSIVPIHKPALRTVTLILIIFMTALTVRHSSFTLHEYISAVHSMVPIGQYCLCMLVALIDNWNTRRNKIINGRWN
jgi:hypothetical protein